MARVIADGTELIHPPPRAVIFVALAISAGFGVCLISDFYAFRTLGLFVPLTMLISCVTALTLLPALVLLLRPGFVFDPDMRGSPVPQRWRLELLPQEAPTIAPAAHSPSIRSRE